MKKNLNESVQSNLNDILIDCRNRQHIDWSTYVTSTMPLIQPPPNPNDTAAICRRTQYTYNANVAIS